MTLRKKGAQTDWALAMLAGVTLMVVLPFIAFLAFAMIAPDAAAKRPSAQAPSSQTVASARPAAGATGAKATTTTPEVVRKKRT